MMCCSASTLRPMRDESMCAERRAPQNQTSLSHAQPSRCTAWRRSAPRRARAAPTDRLRHGGIGPGHQRRGAALCRGTGRLEASREGSARERGKAPCGGRPRLWRPGHCEVPRRLSRFRCRAVQRGRAAAACGACGLLPAASKLARGERQWPGRAAVGGVQRERDGREAPAASTPWHCHASTQRGCSPSAPRPSPWRGGRRLRSQGKARCYEKRRTPRSRSAHATQRTALQAREAMRCAAARAQRGG